MIIEEFTASCACPKCGKVDCHQMRSPAPKPVRGPERVIGGAEIHRFDGMSGPDESMFEVVRICGGCRHEWGQA